MAIVECPNCQGKLRLPDDSSPRRVKCPTCGRVFSAAAEPGPSRRSPDSRADRRRDDEDDRPRRRRLDDEDDDRAARRRYDDDEDDRPRRRRSRDDEDDDRRRSRQESRAIEGQFNRASLACLLCFIGGWVQVGALAVLVLTVLLRWAEMYEGVNVLLIVAGLLGFLHLIANAVGYGFLVSGPRSRGALGLSIATAAVAAFHLLLSIIIATALTAWGEKYSMVSWRALVTQSDYLGQLLMVLIADAGRALPPAGRIILPTFANLAELALVVLFLMTLRAIARSAKDPRRARMVMHVLIANAVGAGVLLLTGVLFGILLVAIRNERGAGMAVWSLFSLIVATVQIGLTVWTTIVIKAVKDGVDYRPD